MPQMSPIMWTMILFFIMGLMCTTMNLFLSNQKPHLEKMEFKKTQKHFKW